MKVLSQSVKKADSMLSPRGGERASLSLCKPRVRPQLPYQVHGCRAGVGSRQIESDCWAAWLCPPHRQASGGVVGAQSWPTTVAWCAQERSVDRRQPPSLASSPSPLPPTQVVLWLVVAALSCVTLESGWSSLCCQGQEESEHGPLGQLQPCPQLAPAPSLMLSPLPLQQLPHSSPPPRQTGGASSPARQ